MFSLPFLIALFLTLLRFGCEGSVKVYDLSCVRCNEDGTNPDECGKNEMRAILCDPEDSEEKKYEGCASVLGQSQSGKISISKSCVAESTRRGIEEATGRILENKECVSLDVPQSRTAQDIWESEGHHLKTSYPAIKEYCFCDSQACNEKAIGNSTIYEYSGSGNLHFTCSLLVATIAMILVTTLMFT